MRLLVSLFMLFLLTVGSSAFGQRFGAAAIIGLNASQIDGDEQFGYRQFGLTGGVRGIAHLSGQVDLQVEMLYSSRGAAAKKQGNEDAAYPVDINLQYAEAPVLLNYKALGNWDGQYVLHICTGFSYSRLLKSEVIARSSKPAEEGDFDITEVESNFNNNEMSWVVGAAFFPIPQLSLGLRHVLALNPLYKSELSGERTLRSYYLQLQAAYLF